MSVDSTLFNPKSVHYPSPQAIANALQESPDYNATKAQRIAAVQLELIKAVKATDLKTFKFLANSFFNDGPEPYLVDSTVGLFVEIIAGLTLAKPINEDKENELPESQELYSDLQKMANIAIAHVCAWPDSYSHPEIKDKTRYRDVVLHQALWLAAQHQETHIVDRVFKAVETDTMDFNFFYSALLVSADVSILGSPTCFNILFHDLNGRRLFKDAQRTAELLGVDEHDLRVQEHIRVLKIQGVATLLEKARGRAPSSPVSAILYIFFVRLMKSPYTCNDNSDWVGDFVAQSLRVYGAWDRGVLRKLVAGLREGEFCLRLEKGVRELVE